MKLFDIFLNAKPSNMAVGVYDDKRGCVVAYRMTAPDGDRKWHLVLTRDQLRFRLKRESWDANNTFDGLANKWKTLLPNGKRVCRHNLAGRDRVIDVITKIRTRQETGDREACDADDDVPADEEYEVPA